MTLPVHRNEVVHFRFLPSDKVPLAHTSLSFKNLRHHWTPRVHRHTILPSAIRGRSVLESTCSREKFPFFRASSLLTEPPYHASYSVKEPPHLPTSYPGYGAGYRTEICAFAKRPATSVMTPSLYPRHFLGFLVEQIGRTFHPLTPKTQPLRLKQCAASATYFETVNGMSTVVFWLEHRQRSLQLRGSFLLFSLQLRSFILVHAQLGLKVSPRTTWFQRFSSSSSPVDVFRIKESAETFSFLLVVSSIRLSPSINISFSFPSILFRFVHRSLSPHRTSSCSTVLFAS